MKDIDHDNDAGLPQELLDELLAGLRPEWPAPERAVALRARVLASIAVAPRDDASLAQAKAALQDITRVAQQRWEERWPGIELCMLRETATSRSYLMRMQPGSVLPAHAHRQDEVSLILEGEALVGGVELLRPGDFQFMPAGVDHAAIHAPGGCIAFVHGEQGFRPRITPSFVARFMQYTVQRWTR